MQECSFLAPPSYNWKLFEAFDPTVIEITRDVEAMSQIVSEFCNTKLKRDDFRVINNPYVVKLLLLLQVSFRYQIRTQTELKRRLDETEKEKNKIKKIYSQQRSKWKELKSAFRVLKSSEKCPSCGMFFISKEKLSRHVKSVHSEYSSFWGAFIANSEVTDSKTDSNEVEKLRSAVETLQKTISCQSMQNLRSTGTNTTNTTRKFSIHQHLITIEPSTSLPLKLPHSLQHRAKTFVDTLYSDETTHFEVSSKRIQKLVEKASKGMTSTQPWSSVREEFRERMGVIHQIPRQLKTEPAYIVGSPHKPEVQQTALSLSASVCDEQPLTSAALPHDITLPSEPAQADSNQKGRVDPSSDIPQNDNRKESNAKANSILVHNSDLSDHSSSSSTSNSKKKSGEYSEATGSKITVDGEEEERENREEEVLQGEHKEEVNSKDSSGSESLHRVSDSHPNTNTSTSSPTHTDSSSDSTSDSGSGSGLGSDSSLVKSLDENEEHTKANDTEVVIKELVDQAKEGDSSVEMKLIGADMETPIAEPKEAGREEPDFEELGSELAFYIGSKPKAASKERQESERKGKTAQNELDDLLDEFNMGSYSSSSSLVSDVKPEIKQTNAIEKRPITHKDKQSSSDSSELSTQPSDEQESEEPMEVEMPQETLKTYNLARPQPREKKENVDRGILEALPSFKNNREKPKITSRRGR